VFLKLSWRGWRIIFRGGIPAAYSTDISSLTGTWFFGLKKGAEKKVTCAAIEKSARAARKDELYHPGGIFT
jgi:hypothetical protein